MPATATVAVPSPLQYDPSKPLGINVVGQSPHVFVYRCWSKVPGTSNWMVLHDGNTVDHVPDFFAVGPFPDGTQIAYWIAGAGKANSVYRVSVIFTQDSKVPVGGTLTHQDKTSKQGGAVVERSVVLV